MKRRDFLEAAVAAAATTAYPAARAQTLLAAHDLQPLIRAVAGDVVPLRQRVKIELPLLAENGNSVPFGVSVDSPMRADDHVKSVHVFAERNPRPLVAMFLFDETAGRAQLNMRIRLAGSQRLLAVAVCSDGSAWYDESAIVVTAGACLDEMSL
jgi:sulfur-oxidizing protein SoxY